MRRKKTVVVVGGLLVASAGACALFLSGPAASWLPECMFHRITGLDCPGCGMTRATHAVLHGRMGEAFRFNPLGMVLMPLVLLGIGMELAGWVRGRPLPLRFRLGKRHAWALFGLLLAFWVLRNIPAWPFTLLAPP